MVEIIVVDNCSSKEDPADLEHFCAENGCTFLYSQLNKGYNAGNNIGLRYAAEKGYDFAMICNPDMEFPDQSYLLKMTEMIVQKTDVVVIASDILHIEQYHQNPMMADGSWTTSLLDFWRSFFPIRREKGPSYIDHYETSHYCSKVSGCCFMIRLDFVREIGFFDEYPFLYCEESILSYQVKRAGMKMYYIADIQAIHNHIKKAKGDPRKGFLHWRRSRAHVIRKYSSASQFGKQIELLFMNMRVFALCFLFTLRNWCQR